MNEDKKQYIEQWLRKAEEDLKAYFVLIDDEINNGSEIDYGRVTSTSSVTGNKQVTANAEKISANNECFALTGF